MGDYGCFGGLKGLGGGGCSGGGYSFGGCGSLNGGGYSLGGFGLSDSLSGGSYNFELGLDYKKLMGISGGDGGMVDYSVM